MESAASPGSSSYLCQMCLGEWPCRTLHLTSFRMDVAPRTRWEQQYRICGGLCQLWMCLAHCSPFCKHCEPLSFQASPSGPFLFPVEGFHAQPKSPAYTSYTYQGTQVPGWVPWTSIFISIDECSPTTSLAPAATASHPRLFSRCRFPIQLALNPHEKQQNDAVPYFHDIFSSLLCSVSHIPLSAGLAVMKRNKKD